MEFHNVYSLSSLSSPLNGFLKSSFSGIGFLGLVVGLTVLTAGLDGKYEQVS